MIQELDIKTRSPRSKGRHGNVNKYHLPSCIDAAFTSSPSHVRYWLLYYTEPEEA